MIESDWDANASSSVISTVHKSWIDNIPRCLAVIFFSPADLIAPAPNTTWQVLELNDLKNSITLLIVSVVNIERFEIIRK